LSTVCESGAVHLLRVLEEVHILDEYASFLNVTSGLTYGNHLVL
jgi:hypothetical protein